MSERVTYIEVDLKRCLNVYGVAACTAALGVTGSKKCFNTLKTCQDRANYSQEIETIRFSKASNLADVNILSVPNISTINYTPARLNLGESIGVRATVAVSFSDHAYPDTGPGGDRYLNDRNYDPFTRGTFWGKFKARHPFLKGQPLRLIQGNTSESIGQMETRHFIIDSISGPDARGNFSIVAKDALKLTDKKKAQAPRLSNGFLATGISSTDLTATLNPIGVGDADYPAAGLAAIGGKEIVTFTRSADVVTIVRSQKNTEAIEHSAGDAFQLCIEYTSQSAANIFNDLLLNYAGIGSSLIPLLSWQEEVNEFNGQLYGATIAEPTPVSQLINELLLQSATSMWWDDLTQLIKIKVLRPSGSAITLYDENINVGASFSQKDQPEKRVSEVWTHYAQRNPLEPLDNQNNYASAVSTIDDESLVDWGEDAIKRIYSRWIPFGGRIIASNLNQLILSRYSGGPRIFGFTLQRDSGVVPPEPAGDYQIKSLMTQDDTGLSVAVDVQAVSVKADEAFYTVTAEEVLFSQGIAPPDPTLKIVPIDSNRLNVDAGQIFADLYGVANSGDVVIIRIYEGVIIGSSSPNLPALKTGNYPAGVTVKLENSGRIQGKGGAGGAGGTASRPSTQVFVAENGMSGLSGGDAILIENDIEIHNANGEIWSGGGGGGGGGSALFVLGSPFNPAYYSGGTGGGGGRGSSDSLAGSGGAKAPSTLFDPYNKAGLDGLIGTFNPAPIENTLVSSSYVNGIRTIGGLAGKGGDAGQAGNNGGPGQVNNYLGAVYVPTPPNYVSKSNGGNGGAAGDAIVQSGFTVNIISTGDIKGAIV